MVTCGDKSRYTWMIVDQAWIRQEGIPGNPLILFGLRKLSAIWFCCNLLLNNRYLSQLPFELSAAAVFVLRGSEQASTDADCTETDRISLVQGEPSITFLRSCSFFWELNFKILAAAGSCRSFLVALVGGGVFSLDAFEANFFCGSVKSLWTYVKSCCQECSPGVSNAVRAVCIGNHSNKQNADEKKGHQSAQKKRGMCFFKCAYPLLPHQSCTCLHPRFFPIGESDSLDSCHQVANNSRL